MTTVTFEIPDDLAADLLSMPEGERNRLAVAALQAHQTRTESRPARIEEIDAALDELSRILPPDLPPLSEEALTRAGIYQDHP